MEESLEEFMRKIPEKLQHETLEEFLERFGISGAISEGIPSEAA